jgi:hypothetical protein
MRPRFIGACAYRHAVREMIFISPQPHVIRVFLRLDFQYTSLETS